MPRDENGNYTLPLPQVVSGATIESTWANTTLEDVRVAMQDSVSRTAQGSMQQELKLVDGTAATPGVAFVSEANTGMYRIAAGQMGFSALGTPYLRITSTDGVQISEDGVAWVDAVGTDITDLLAAEVAQNAADITQNTTDISTNTAAISVLQAQTDYVADSFKSNGPIRHKLLGNAAVNVAAGTRTRIDNPSGLTISFTNVPSGSDPDLPGDYEAEGNVIVWNGTSTSAPTVSTGNLGTVKTIGAPVDTDSVAQVLTYFMCWDGSLKTTLIWSAL